MKKARIIIVEDNLLISIELNSRLTGLGYDIIKVTDTGEGAITECFKLSPDLILMDIRLKGDMDGIEAAKEIRSQCDIPILFVSAYSDDCIIEKSNELGSCGYIVKPFENYELFKIIESTLSHYRDNISGKY